MMEVHCPVCDRSMESAVRSRWPEFPFCGARCKLIDLGRWLGERYVTRPQTETEESALPNDEFSVP
jgi:endogenous inhibitor of DNA gyrase (YacG/DUF329 family)